MLKNRPLFGFALPAYALTVEDVHGGLLARWRSVVQAAGRGPALRESLPRLTRAALTGWPQVAWAVLVAGQRVSGARCAGGCAARWRR